MGQSGQFAGWSDEKLSDYIATKPSETRSYGMPVLRDTRFYDAQDEARQRQSRRDAEYRKQALKKRNQAERLRLTKKNQAKQLRKDKIASNAREDAAAKRNADTASRLQRERDERLNKYKIEARTREEESIAKREDQWKQQQAAYQAQQRESDKRATRDAETQSAQFMEAARVRQDSAKKMQGTYNRGMGKSTTAIDSAQKEASALLEPWRQYGVDAAGKLAKKVSSGPGSFKKSPGYDARLAEGTRAIESSAAARGGALSGRAMKEAARFNQEFASNDYDNFLRRYYDSLAPLQEMSRMGQSAATSQGGYLQRAGSEKSNIYQSGYDNIAKAQMYGGEAGAEGIEGSANIMAAQSQAKQERDYAYSTFQMGDRA